ncbi:MAG: RlmE family RNA methyltransferase [Desulfamplus sp.]|nr:RlmE family RNA methyltransferase [Desulfamplus sp.]
MSNKKNRAGEEPKQTGKRGGKSGARGLPFKKGGQQWADHLTHRAKQENYPARSVYKLMDIQKKYSVLKKGGRVLDLGCAPGSWLLHAAKIVGDQGAALGIDLKKIDIPLPSNASAHVGDIFKMHEELAGIVGNGYDTVLSDMAPATTGRKDVDAARSLSLARGALDAASGLLRPGGHFVCKIFQGPEFKEFERDVKKAFGQCAVFKPESCRKSSKEIYIIGKDKK